MTSGRCAGLCALTALALVSAVTGCSLLRSQLILDRMNSPDSCPALSRETVQQRAARITFTAVADSYFDKAAVGEWMDAIAAHPEPILTLYAWTLKHPHPSSTGGCAGMPAEGLCARDGFEDFRRTALPPTTRGEDGQLTATPSVWQLPGSAVCLDSPVAPKCPSGSSDPEDCPDEARRPPGACPTAHAAPGPFTAWRPVFPTSSPGARATVDEERLVANLASVVPSLVALQNVVDPAPGLSDIRAGIVDGLAHARRYVTARGWNRTVARPRVALVLSGGAGTGAFEAGFVNRLLALLEKCADAPEGAKCDGAGIDLVVGTSTGSLVGFLIDRFSVGGAQRKYARDLLRYEYTCSAKNDLYCTVSAPISQIMSVVPGLVQFDGIRKLMEDNWIPKMATNSMELVTMSVDYQSGNLYADSDQDPDDAADGTGRVDSVMASIVEPLMAYPVRELHRAGKPALQGTFIDGGIRSGLPVMQAMARGAERAIVVSTSSIDPDPARRQNDAVSIVLRTIDLMVEQPRVTETQQADLAATSRRMSEYNLCKHRYQYGATGTQSEAALIEDFCRRSFALPVAGVTAQAAAAGWATPGSLEQVASSWESSWVYRSEKPIPGMSGYSFDPKQMRDLYLEGVDTFQARCREVIDLFFIRGTRAIEECNRPLAQVEQEEQGAFADLAACEAKVKQEARRCPTR